MSSIQDVAEAKNMKTRWSQETNVKQAEESFRPSVRPLFDRVVVLLDQAETMSKGGVILPDRSQERQQEGEVVAVGPGGFAPDGKVLPMQVALGDRVCFHRGVGVEKVVEGKECLVLGQYDLLLVVGGDS